MSPSVVDYEKLLEERPELKGLVTPRLTPYIPHEPTLKQRLFLCLPHREAFYGGAAGGGKSDALLMGALQYVDVPGYSAIIFRKTFADLKLPEALIARSHEWLSGTDAKWDNQQHQWVFPSGAVLAFGYLDSELVKFRYASAAFQFVGFDELSQFWEDDYLFLFSRLRGLACSVHRTDEYGDPIYVSDCQECQMRRIVPKRMRSASNPGGIGHVWIRERFKIEKSETQLSKIPPKIKERFKMEDNLVYLGGNTERPFVPSFVWDNPYLLVSDYIESLNELDPVTREQLLRGDWGVSADGRFKKSWVKYYSRRADYIIMGTQGRGESYHRARCRMFITVDPAASAREGPGDAQVWRRAPSWTVISTWLVTPRHDLIWYEIRRFRKEVPEVIEAICVAFKEHCYPDGQRPEFVGIEANGLGIGVYQAVSRLGLPVRSLNPRSLDKLVRATDLANRMEQGKVWLPEQNSAPWLIALENELFSWTGHPHEPADQIDTGSYAATIVSQDATFSEPRFYDTYGLESYSDTPAAW